MFRTPVAEPFVSNIFCPSAVFEYLFFQDGEDWFEGTLGLGDRCFKEPKPSRPYWRSPGLVYHNSLASISLAVVSSPKLAAVVFTPALYFYWEGLHWDFSSELSFCLPPLFRISSIPTPKHRMRYLL